MKMPREPKVPVIETERLRLRGHRPEDLVESARLWADPVVTRYIGGRPLSEEEVWGRILRYAGHWSWFGFGYWLVEEKISRRFVGEVGFADYKRDIQPSSNGVPELGWALTTTMSGQGYATESVQAAIGWFESHFTFSRTVCLITPENIASVRVARKCGYQEQHLTAYQGHAVMIFARDMGRGAYLPALL